MERVAGAYWRIWTEDVSGTEDPYEYLEMTV